MKQNEETKKIYIRRDLNEEERKELMELKREVKSKNKMRTEVQQKSFYWMVIDMKIQK